MGKLILLQGDRHRLFELQGSVVTIGRAADNALWIEDLSLSRRHCELRRTDGRWWLLDRGSFNGTFVNDLSVQEHPLAPGDRIQLGSTVCYFLPDDGEVVATDRDEQRAADQASREATSRKLRNFMALLEIAKAVNSELSRARLLTMLVRKSIELVSAARGFLILLKEGRPNFEVALKADGAAVEEPEKLISSNVLEKVTSTGEPVVTINAQNDLGSFLSIVALEVRSLICVPLRVKDSVRGALYVDSHVAEREFDEESLNLLQAFADQAAIALENATLYDAVLASREQEERVRRIFQKYVPADVVTEVLQLKEGARLSVKQTATVLFSDIRSFTSISERLEPEEVVSFLNDYLQRMVDVVFESGGIIDKFVGDAVMAVFGAPVPHPEDAARAVGAAQRMLEEVDRFNLEQRARGGVEIEVGIGIHTGPLIAGTMGSDKKMEYTVIGDTVNVASRVESLNKELGTRLLITGQTYEAAGRSVEVRALPPVPVKGKAGRIQVYEVLPADRAEAETQAAPRPASVDAGLDPRDADTKAPFTKVVDEAPTQSTDDLRLDLEV